MNTELVTTNVAEIRAISRSLLWAIAVFSFVSWTLYGQRGDSRSPSPAPATQSSEIISSAGSYTLEWRRHYQRQAGLALNGIADEAGTLWLITHAGPGKLERSLTKISPGGQLLVNYNPVLPLNPFEWVGDLAPAASGRSIGLLASLVSGGRDQTFEGAFFMPVGADGLGNPVPVASRGPQFQTMIGAGSDGFVVAGDQEPLTLLGLDLSGKVLWRRSFSRTLVLPTVSIGTSGSIFVVSQGGSYLLVQMLGSSGRVLRSERISAKQGTVVSDSEGGCSLLVSTGFNGKDNRVYLLTLDKNLKKLKRFETPLVGWGGRTYQLISTPHGHLVVGESPKRNPQNETPQVIAEFDRSGTLIWQQATSSLATLLLAPFASGFYVVRDDLEGNGMDVEKYLY